MRQNIKSTSRRFTAPQVKIGQRNVVILTEDERIDVPIPDGIPADLELPEAGTQLRNVVVSMNGSGDKLYGMFPATGTHIVAFERFASREGEVPSPRVQAGGERKMKDGRKWYAPDRLVFTVLLRVLSGPFASMIIPWTIDYIFERDTDGTVMLNGSKRSIERVTRFLELTGFDIANETIRWSDNILPDLEMLLSTDSYFQVTMQNGWVDEAAELPAGVKLDNPSRKAKAVVEDEDDAVWDDEDAPVKRTSRSVAADEEPFADEEEAPAKPAARPARRIF